jgi:hypothetical protein
MTYMTHVFFTSGMFWFLEGVLAVAVLIGFKIWMEDRSVPMPFWKWPIVIAWFLAAGVVIAFVGTSLGENELQAAELGGYVFGTIVFIMGVIAWRVIQIGRPSRAERKAAKEATSDE